MKLHMKRRMQSSAAPGTRRRFPIAAWGGEEGNALIEVAVGVTICITLLIGAAQCGHLAYDAIEVTNAAHTGAEYGAQSRTYAADTSNITAAAVQDASNVPGLTATATYFCSCSDGSTSTCAPTDCSASRIITYVRVNTSATVDPQVYLPGLPRTYTLTGKAVMRVAQ
jgi:Flp pilus assembly protein TadG